MSDDACTAFILTREARDTPRGLTFRYWAASAGGPVLLEVTGQEGVFFLPRDVDAPADRRCAVDLRTLDGRPVDALYFRSLRALRRCREHLEGTGQACESDIRPADRYLMERFITGPVQIAGQPVQRRGYRHFTDPVLRPGDAPCPLRVASLDIETDGLDGALYSIGLRCEGRGRVFMVGKGQDSDLTTFLADERAALLALFGWIQDLDPDLIVGWNVTAFDLLFLANRCKALGLAFALGRCREPGKVLPGQRTRQPARAEIPGRMVIDGIVALRTAGYHFEDFSLEAVGQSLLGKGKLIGPEEDRVAEIRRLYTRDPHLLAAYNLQDCDLVLEIFDHTGLVPFLRTRAALTGLTLDRMPGSIAAFEFLYLPRLHRRGRVAPDLTPEPDPNPNPGGYVMDSLPGLYENVLVFDFKSLYPSIIRTFHIDPLALHDPGEDPIPGFHGGSFSRNDTILGDLITTLWAAREDAKRKGDHSLNLATKILMNAFYGVLGTPACRFYDPRLASSITRRSHEILLRSKAHLADLGHQVIYGDTDSLFLALGNASTEDEALRTGRDLAAALNTWWRETVYREFRVHSHLELEFETCYLKFLMPTIRGSEKGTKKRYAGLKRQPDGSLDVIFRGLESVRSDWTPLARRFQRELYRRIFLGEPYEAYIRDMAGDLLAGRLDDELVYRKRLRKPVSEYTRNVPPQVQAARKLPAFTGSTVHYLVTLHGPEPIQIRQSPIDYAHYLEHQLAPVADAILTFLGTRFDRLTDTQLWLFDVDPAPHIPPPHHPL